MPLRLKTKLTLSTALLVLAVAALISGLYVARLVRQVIGQASGRAGFVSQQVFFNAQQALNDAAEAGEAPASTNLEAVRAYVRQALEESAGLTSMIDASVGYSFTIYEVTVTDHHGVALISSDPALPGQVVPHRPPLSDLVQAGFLQQVRMLYGPQRVFELSLPFNLSSSSQLFGEIRVSLSTAFLREEIDPELREAGWAVLLVVLLFTLLAAVVSHVYLSPLAKISAQLDRISKGEVVPAALSGPDEFGQVSTKISLIGQQLRGVQEIFGALRENVNHIMAGLHDGMILFTRDGRAVLVSPAVEKFLGMPPESLTGKTVEEIFPQGHPLRTALQLDGLNWRNVDPVEVHLNGSEAPTSRVTASVQVIVGPQRNESIGALLTLRDVESMEKLDSQLQVSERLAALGRVTAGVAHEVKNPLNSMRLWLENLKQTMPPFSASAGQAPPMAQQAVQILDSEIDRLDRVVKTFLDFSRPVELALKETDACELLREVAAVVQPQFERAGIDLAIHCAQDSLHFLADKPLLQQAVVNLTLNALEALERVPPRSGRGRVTLACEARNSAAIIRVQDNGPGIPPENRARIFQLFFTTRPGGSGIGLATAFRIVQLHNGSMDFESEPGLGAKFWMEFPLA